MAHGFRPYDEAELAAKLGRVTGLVVALYGEDTADLEEAAKAKIRRELSPALAQTLLEHYHYDAALSGAFIVVFVRRTPS